MKIKEVDRFERHLGNKMNWAVGGRKGKFEKEIQKGHGFPALASPYGPALPATAPANYHQQFILDECTVENVKLP